MGFYTQAVLRSEFEHAQLVPKSLLNTKQAESRSPATGASLLWKVPGATLKAEQARYQAVLEAAAPTLGSPPTDDDLKQVRRLLGKVLEQPPTQLDGPRVSVSSGGAASADPARVAGDAKRRAELARRSGM